MSTRSTRRSVFSLAPLIRWSVGAGCLCVLLAACGGGGDDAPLPVENPPAAVAPQLTQQPADLSVTSGQPASFTVAGTGTAPLLYQWQRNGTAIAGATAATYSLATTASTDSGAVFRAVVSNTAGSATSNAATLTVNAASPVLTITAQPVDASIVAGSPVSFTAGGTCSAGTVQSQWQRLIGATFSDISGATSATYTFTPAIVDNGGQFRVNLSCSGQSTASSRAVTLTVTAPPSGGVLAQVVVSGLRNQAEIRLLTGIVREPSGSFAFISAGTIRRLSADLSTITLIAGSETNTGPAVDGVGAAASFTRPYGITVDPLGNLYIVDIDDQTVRRIAIDGTVTTIAGRLHANGTADGTGSAARFNYPRGIAIGPDGDLYVSDGGNFSVRRVTPAGVVTTYAGSSGIYGYADGSPSAARFDVLGGIAVGPDGTVFVADIGNSRIRKISRSGNAAQRVDTLAGGLTSTSPADGSGTFARIVPREMTLQGTTLYVRDFDRLVRAVDVTTGAVTTVTGNSAPLPGGLTVSYSDGPRGIANIDRDNGSVAAIGDGRLILTDFATGALRLVGTDGYITTIANYSAYQEGVVDHTGIGVLAQQPFAFRSRPALAAAPDGSIVVAAPRALRRINPDGSVTPIAGLVGSVSAVDGSASAGSFNNLSAAAVKSDGTVVVFDATSIRTVAPLTHAVTTLAGSLQAGANDGIDGAGAAARFGSDVTSMAVAANGDILLADTLNAAIRRITPAGAVTTFAGAMGQFGGVDGPAGTARFQRPTRIAFGPDGTLWVMDRGSQTAALRKVAPDGSVTTFPVSGVDLGFGTVVLAFDPSGSLFLSAAGIYQMNTTTGVATLLIPSSSTGTSLGNPPRIAIGADRLIAVGVKQLVFSDDDLLLRATLP